MTRKSRAEFPLWLSLFILVVLLQGATFLSFLYLLAECIGAMTAGFFSGLSWDQSRALNPDPFPEPQDVGWAAWLFDAKASDLAFHRRVLECDLCQFALDGVRLSF
jgi:hypothetical protein